MAKIGPRSYVVDVWAKQGTVLGGVKSTSSSYFASRADAERWRSVAVQANREAGRDVESRIVASQHRAEIPASPDDSTPAGWDAIDPDDVPNLDAMEADELREWADRVADGSALAPLPDDVRSAMLRYASLRITAIQHRLAGRIQASLEVGHQQDALYREIPAPYRW